MHCRSCSSNETENFIDLGFAPPSNAYLSEYQLTKDEIYFPLKVNVCKKCWLVQTQDFVKKDDLFTKDYAYLSSSSKSWVEHSKAFALESIIDFNLSEKSFVIEVASNDGYLLRNYKNNKIPCLGIEPTYSTAKIARSYGLSVVEKFCTYKNAREISKSYGKADLLIGNNVFAHVPDINDFTLGMKELLKSTGILS